MARYFYKWTPFVIVGSIVFLSIPWLGVIALLIVSLVALPMLAFAVVFVPYTLIRAVRRGWQGQHRPRPRTAATLSPVARQPTLRKSYVS
jgi:hypothetical protein